MKQTAFSSLGAPVQGSSRLYGRPRHNETITRSTRIAALVGVILFWGAVCAVVFAAPIETPPENAYFNGNEYGRGWDCNHGFRLTSEKCEAIDVPENAYLRSSGTGWFCDRGYKRGADGCEKIAVPANAFLADHTIGTGWICERGYRPSENACIETQVPDNGYLANGPSSRGWACLRGFKPVDQACIEVKVPENAHLDYFGTGWDCNRSHVNLGSKCVARASLINKAE